MTFIGIDGGGTTTRVLIQQGSGEPDYFEFPVSLKILKGDFIAAAKKLQQLVAEGEEIRDLRIAIGLAGMSREENQDAFKGAILSLPEFSDACVHIEGDATLALKAALATSEEGVLLIAGTGSVAYARMKDGTITRVGGWGPETSDEGSGYWIGLRVLRHYLRMVVMGNQKDELFLAVKASLPKQVSSPREIANHLEREPLFPASLAAIVFECANRSEDAMGIVDEAAAYLRAMIEEVSEQLGYPRRVYLSGSIAKHALMVEEIRKLLPSDRFELLQLDDRAPAKKALEIARSL
jgi:N-acetylglucosamine kinase-like BadF-type ATPase